MGSWGETQLKQHRNNKPHFAAWIPYSSEQGEKDGKRGQKRSPLTKNIIFKKFYRSTLQTLKPDFGPRPRAVSGNTATSCTFLKGLTLLGSQLSCLQAVCVDGEVRAKGASLFTLAKSEPAQLTALHESEAQFPSRWWGFPNTVEMQCSRPALLKPALVIWLFKY